MLYIKLFIEREKNIGQSAPECPFKGQICTSNRLRFVRSHCPFHGHISKTKQDRPIIRPTMEHYIEVGTADSFAAFRSSAKRRLGDILVSNVEKSMFRY